MKELVNFSTDWPLLVGDAFAIAVVAVLALRVRALSAPKKGETHAPQQISERRDRAA